MKNYEKLLFLFAGISLMVSCSKDEGILSDETGDSGILKNAYAPKVYVVYPSGIDDTQALTYAFQEAQKDPKSIVQLKVGTYYCNLLEIHEFNGSFRGAGKGKTIITPIPGGFDCEKLTKNGLLAFLIKFIGGQIYVSDMTLKVPQGSLCSKGSALPGLLLFADYSNTFMPDHPQIKATVNNVAFEGYYSEEENSSLTGLYATHDSDLPEQKLSHHIELTVTNCTFNKFYYGVEFACINEGIFSLGGVFGGNVFNNCYIPASIYNVINSRITVHGNVINLPKGEYYGLDVDNWPWSNCTFEPQVRKTFVVIKNNIFNNKGGDCALWAHDHRRFLYPDEAGVSMVVLIEGNKLFMSDEAYVGFSLPELSGPIIRYNFVTGSGYAGIASNSCTPDNYTNNGLYLNNIFFHTDFEFADLVLGPSSRDFIVIGRNDNINIIDRGINNKIINVIMNKNNLKSASGKSNIEDLNTRKTKMLPLRVQ